MHTAAWTLYRREKEPSRYCRLRARASAGDLQRIAAIAIWTGPGFVDRPAHRARERPDPKKRIRKENVT